MGLVVSHLHKKYGEKTVVEDLSFEMREPGVYALLGTNGAGKTTSIRMMLNILAKDGGEVLWNDRPLDINTCNVGYLAEERGLYPKYALMDQLMYFASLRGVSKADAKKRIAYWAERLEVEEYLYPGKKTAAPENAAPAPMFGRGRLSGARNRREKPRLADQLSKGNQQKIQFMTALLSDPELIVLDEPMSGLDPVNMDIVRNIIREEIRGGRYLIMSSHQMPTVEEFCTDLTILNRSRSVLQGNLNEIKKQAGRIYLHLKTEQDVSEQIQRAGITLLSEKEHEYQLKVSQEDQAYQLQYMLAQARIPMVTFDLREPSLHEIFVEKVGENHEA